MLMSAGIGVGCPRGRTTLSFVCVWHTRSQMGNWQLQPRKTLSGYFVETGDMRGLRTRHFEGTNMVEKVSVSGAKYLAV